MLEHLIGAMTVQKMMDERKEANTPVHQEDEEHVPDAELSADDVCSSRVDGWLIGSLKSRRSSFQRRFTNCVVS